MESMDLFGEAIYNYHKGIQKGDFYLVNNNGEKFKLDLGIYFRNIDELDELEIELIKNIKGNSLLDIGCGTAFYFPVLNEKIKNVEGIDISKDVIKVAKENGIKNVKKLDILNEKIEKKYDIVTLLGNNLSIGGDIEGTKKLLNILKSILNKNGKILSYLKKEDDEEYFIGEFSCEYDGKKSNTFKWIRFNIDFLKKLLNEQGLKLKILKENNYGYSLEIINN